MSDRTFNFALVGAGRIAQTHLDALAELEGAALKAVVEPRQDSGRAVAEQNRCDYHADHLDPALLDGLDGVLICAPPSCHHDIAGYFLDHGVHVLCEKPFTLTTAEAEGLVARAEQKGLCVMMASKFRYVEDVIRAKALIESGILGKAVLYQNAFCGKVDMAERWNSDASVSGGGVLIDNGTHSVDIARYLLGPLRAVEAQAGVAAQALPVEDTAHLCFRTAAGVKGSVDLSWSINNSAATYIDIYGTGGIIQVGWQGSRYKQEGSPDWVEYGSGYNKVAAFKGQLRNFIGTARGEEQPLITPAAAVASVRIIEAAYRSMKQEAWVALGEEALA